MPDATRVCRIVNWGGSDGNFPIGGMGIRGYTQKTTDIALIHSQHVEAKHSAHRILRNGAHRYYVFG